MKYFVSYRFEHGRDIEGNRFVGYGNQIIDYYPNNDNQLFDLTHELEVNIVDANELVILCISRLED